MLNKKHKRIAIALWLILILSGLALYLRYGQGIDASRIGDHASYYHNYLLTLYFLIVVTRGITFVPLTPFMVAAILLFNPGEFYFVHVSGALISAAIVYNFASGLGLHEYFEKKFPSKLRTIKKSLTNREQFMIALWSFFPLTPTDLIVYASSTLGIRLSRILLGVLLGEGTVTLFYILSVRGLFG